MAKGKNTALAQNRKARHEYDIIDTIEAGIVLRGTEIKSVRAGQISLQDGFAAIEDGEIFLFNTHIAPYEQGNIHNHDPLRKRKRLMHQNQIDRLHGQVSQKGMTLIPLKVYIKNGVAKVLIGLAKGKRQYDKRETIKRRDQERQIDRAIKENY
jgi:SsrA-binding protein